MADADPLAALSDTERSAVQQYTSVTGQDSRLAVQQLQRSQWNVELAVNRFFEPEPTASDAAAAEALQAAEYARAHGTAGAAASTPALHPTPSAARPNPAVRRNLIPAPRIVPQPNAAARRPPMLLTILLYPLSFAWRLTGSIFGLLYTLFPFLPRLRALNRGAASTPVRRSQNPRDTAARFIRAFEEEYGSSTRLPWFEGGYAQALDTAKSELRYLLVILQSDEHDDTASFNRHTLVTQEIVDFLRQNKIILWGGSVQESEAYQVSTALNCTKFPFAGLIALAPGTNAAQSSQGMSVITRIAGPTEKGALVRKLQAAIDAHNPSLEGVRHQRVIQAADRAIRDQQEDAYRRSLLADQERARREREAAEAARREQEEAERRQRAAEELAEKKAQWRRWRKARLEAEPEGDGVRISIRTPDGKRIIRKFVSNARMEEVYAFVECLDVDEEKAGGDKPVGYSHEYGFHLVGIMPRTVYESDAGSVGECLGKSGNLVVEPLDDEDDEDDA